jgi:hypothetical protein
VLARLENFRVPGGRPYLALAEEVELTIAGRRVSLSLARGSAREAAEGLGLPEGEHRYTVLTRARARCFPEGGHFPFALDLTGSGKGKVLVREGTRLILRRGACEGGHYTARLERRE